MLAKGRRAVVHQVSKARGSGGLFWLFFRKWREEQSSSIRKACGNITFNDLSLSVDFKALYP